MHMAELMKKYWSLRRLLAISVISTVFVFLTGCGTTFRPVVLPQPTSGPSAQPTAYAVVVSYTGQSNPGIATIIDYSGDTILAQSQIGAGPLTFTEDGTGTNSYSLNSDLTLTNFQVSSNLQYKNLGYSSLPGGMPNTPAYTGIFSPNTGLWVTDANNAIVDVLTGVPATYKLSVPVAPLPVLTVGPNTGGQRNYVVSQNNSTSSSLSYDTSCNNNASHSLTQLGEADGIELQTYTVSSRIPVGVCPVYALQTPDLKRVFVLNRGSDTVSVINSQLNTLDDQCPPPTGCQNQAGQTYFSHPELPLSLSAVSQTNITPPNGTAGMTQYAGPVYAEYNQATSQLVIADYDGGTITLIDVSLDEYGNDSQTFGTTYTIPVGNNPASVTALYDGSRAYAANQSDGTVSIVNLTSHTLEKTLAVNGNPRTVTSTQNSQYGKVYVVSPNSPYLTIIRTDLDIVDTALLIEGTPIDVRTSNQNGSSGNAITSSRFPGAGRPCFLPPGQLPANPTLAQCQQIP